MTEPQRLTRRRFLGTAAAGSLAVAGLGALAPKALSGASPRALGERLVPPGKLALQQFSLRDAVTRRGIAASNAAGVTPTMGYLGGPNFPDDPTDLGPLVPLPGGFAEVFEYLASVGYKGFEFFQSRPREGQRTARSRRRRSAPRSTTPACGRSARTPAASRTCSTRRPRRSSSRSRRSSATRCSAPPATRAAATRCRTTRRTRTRSGWQTAADRANAIVAELAPLGMKWYWHPEQNSCRFFNDPAHPELSTVRRIDWWAENVPGSYLRARHPARSREPAPLPGGRRVEVGLLRLLDDERAPHHRLAREGRHADRSGHGAGREPVHRRRSSGRRPSPTRSSRSRDRSGSATPSTPIRRCPGSRSSSRTSAPRARTTCSSRATAGPARPRDPGRSLRHAKISAQNLLGLRGGTSAKHQSSSSEESPFESEAEVG